MDFRPVPKPIALEPVPALEPVYLPVALQKSVFKRLPPEIILSIADFLSPQATLSFSLCCRPIHSRIQKHYLVAVETSKRVLGLRLNFLQYLERDLPFHIICYYCKKLHSMNEAHKYKVTRNTFFSRDWTENYPLCSQMERTSYVYRYIHPKFTFVIFRMVMKCHQQGFIPPNIQALMSFPTTISSYDHYTQECSVSTRIIGNSMLVRQQKIFKIQPMDQCPVAPDKGATICPHVVLSWNQYINGSRRDFQVEYPRRNAFQGKDRIVQCKYCPTEFQIDFMLSNDHVTILMFVTKWMDLGPGCSLLDREWASRNIDTFCLEILTKVVEFKPGSICGRFEGKEYYEFKFDSLLAPQDKKKLLKLPPYYWSRFNLRNIITVTL